MLVQAYKVKDARDLYDDTMIKGVPALDWAAVQSAPPIDRSLSPLRPYYWCCGLRCLPLWLACLVQRGGASPCGGTAACQLLVTTWFMAW